MIRNVLVAAVACLLWGCPCESPDAVVVDLPRVAEHTPRMLPLSGAIATPDAEISGMAWAGDTLVLMPQYPHRFKGGSDGAVFTLKRAEIEAVVSGASKGPLVPQAVPFVAPGVSDAVAGYEGFESIVVRGGRVWLTIEANQSADAPGGYLISGLWEKEGGLRLEPTHLTPIARQHTQSNKSYESLLDVGEQGLLAFYEVNGAPNPAPKVMGLTAKLKPKQSLAMPELAYRLTDVTAMDKKGEFWALNYFWPGDDDLRSPNEPLRARYGVGETHAQHGHVERLVAFQYSAAGVVRVERAPVWLALGEKPRNWEGVVRFGKGVLLVTDEHPETLLAYVEISP